MRRPITIQSELNQIHTVEDLTSVFESIASMHISRIRNRVVASRDFFSEIWQTYRSLRIDPEERLSRKSQVKKGHNVFLAVTSEGKFNSDVVEQIVGQVMEEYQKQPQNTDIMVIGSRGALQLELRGAPIARAFSLPSGDLNINVGKIIDALSQYDKIAVFYQTYESLRTQSVARIDLVSAVRDLGDDVGEEGETVSSQDYIFEPNINEIADFMESLMMGVALIQIIMDSKLAGYASRFNTMNQAKHRAGELVTDLRRQYQRSKRAESDERLKEIMKVVKTHERNRAS